MQTYQYALTQHQSGNLELAEKKYREILDAEPNNVAVLHLLAILLAQKQDFVKAKFYLEKALRLNPQMPTLHISMGNILRNLEDYEVAIQHYLQAIKSEPNNATAYNNIANVYYNLKEFDQAADYYKKALRINPNYADAHYNLALILAKQDAANEAIKHVERALELQPKYAKAHYLLAYLLQMQNAVDRAARHYQKSLRCDPNDPAAHHNLATILVGKKKFPAAAYHFKKTLQFQPTNVDALHNLGSIFLLQKNPAAALKYFLRITELQRDFTTYFNLGVIYMDLGRLPDAINYFNEALSMQAKDKATLINLGAIYLRMENYPAAVKYYKEALKLDPDNKEVAFVLSALTGKDNPNTAPDEYIQSLFDQYAANYDKHLELLNYQVPQLIYDAAIKIFGSPQQQLAILDLGCGTGLTGEKLQGFTRKLIGVDLSPKMLEIAKDKKIYSNLYKMSALEALQKFLLQDLIVAADFLVYVGDLQEIFAAANNALVSKGYFIFTVEKTEHYPYLLQQTARFAHSLQYIQELAQATAFKIITTSEVILRKQKNTEIAGYLFVLQK